MQTLLGADLIVQSLAREGISHVFTLPGGQMSPIHFAVNEEPGMELIIPRHEGAGALMAAGYSLASGKPASVMTTVGAGIAYEIGALYFAWKERLPLISIAPQVQSYKMKPIQENLQACDQDEIFKPITKFNAILYHRDRIPSLIRRALKVALAPEQGPVHLDAPVDIVYGFKMVSNRKMKKLFPNSHFRFNGLIMPDNKHIEPVLEAVGGSKKPLVLVGRNVERARAGKHLEAFLHQLNFPVITSSPAFASVKFDYEGNLGTCNLWDDDTNMELLSNTDLILLFEADEDTARLTKKLVTLNPAISIIQTAELAASVGSIAPLTHGLMGSPSAILESLSETMIRREIKPMVEDNWRADLLSAKSRIKDNLRDKVQFNKDRLYGILHAIEKINATIRPEDVVVCEGETASFAAMVHLKHPGLHNTVILADDDIPGAGFPISLGVKLAKPDARIFLISETDQFKRHHREFQTQSRYNLGTTSFLFQAKNEKPEEEIDFSILAKSLGVPAQVVTDPEEELTDTLMNEAFSSETGMLLDVSL